MNELHPKDYLTVELVFRYIDRMSDPCPEDPAETILSEFVKEFESIWELSNEKQ